MAPRYTRLKAEKGRRKAVVDGGLSTTLPDHTVLLYAVRRRSVSERSESASLGFSALRYDWRRFEPIRASS